MRLKMGEGRHALSRCFWMEVSVLHLVCICDHLGRSPWYVLMCSVAGLGAQAQALNGPRVSGLAVLTDGAAHPPGRKALVQPRGRARKESVPLPKAAADGGASLSGRPMTLRGAIWQSCWQELPCSMDAGDCPGLE